MHEIQPYLMNMIDPEDDFKTILVIESKFYLQPLRERFPTARIFFVTSDEDFLNDPAMHELCIEVKILVYQEEPMKFPKEYFDLVMSDLTLENVGNPQDIALGISSFIKDTGFFITSFRNIRHWRILKDLMAVKYPGIVSRLYARPGFEKILYATFFKDIRFALLKDLPQKESDKELFDRLLECGFEVPADLEVEFWLVRAGKAMPELALLKLMYTPEERREFSFILHRIEYEVETEKNVELFWKFFHEHQMYIDYATLFIHEAVIHRFRFYDNLQKFSQGMPELNELIDSANDTEERFE